MKKELITDPSYFPFELSSDRRIGFLKIASDTFKKSSFLDKRIVVPDRQLIYEDASELEKKLKDLKCSEKKDLIHIFHISHVGSTFISKLLESINELKVLREPNILKNFIREYYNLSNTSSEYKKNELDSMLHGILNIFLLGRESKVLIKHMSHNLYLPLRNIHLENISQKEILLYTNLQNFLYHSISSEGLKRDALTNASFRLDQLNNLCFSNSFKIDDLEYLEIVSIIWIVEFAKIYYRKLSKENALMLNFDNEFSENKKEETMEKIVKYIFDGDLHNFQTIMSSQYWHINPKNGDEYSFQARDKAIRSNKFTKITEVERVCNWVESICKEEPYLLPLLRYINH
ncbi:hypothetical protein N9K79_02115 [Gammaproteobacteria bacterium]|nr:hypothetical protein [Gammaproteobacteria bacterium]